MGCLPQAPISPGTPQAHLAWHRHDNGLALALVQLEEPAWGTGSQGPAEPPDPSGSPKPPWLSPGDLTLADIQPTLGHEAHAPLGLLAAVGVQVVHVGSLVRDLEVPDAAVTLRGGDRCQPALAPSGTGWHWGCTPGKGGYLPTEVDNAGIGVVEGQQDPVARVHLLQGNGLLKVILGGRSSGGGV